MCVCVLRLAGLQKIFDGDDACSSSTKLLLRYKSSFSMDGKQHENGGNEKNCPKHVLLLCKDLHVSSAFAIVFPSNSIRLHATRCSLCPVSSANAAGFMANVLRCCPSHTITHRMCLVSHPKCYLTIAIPCTVCRHTSPTAYHRFGCSRWPLH